MKLDDELRLVILEKVGIYSKRFSTPEPQVFFTNKEVMSAPKEITEGCRTTAYKYYGVSYMEKNTIFINVKKIPDEKTLENTIVHELIHQRFPYQLVRQGLRGKTFDPYKKRNSTKISC